MLGAVFYITLERSTFMLGMLGLLVVSVSWLTRPDRERLCPMQLFAPFLLLAILALDGGLVRLLSMISEVVTRMGRTWPGSRATGIAYRAMPLMLTFLFGGWALWAILRAKPSLRLTVATAIVAVVALVQGLVRICSISPRRLTEIFTGYPGNDPWALIGAVVPAVFVLVAVVLVLSVRHPGCPHADKGKPGSP